MDIRLPLHHIKQTVTRPRRAQDTMELRHHKCHMPHHLLIHSILTPYRHIHNNNNNLNSHMAIEAISIVRLPTDGPSVRVLEKEDPSERDVDTTATFHGRRKRGAEAEFKYHREIELAKRKRANRSRQRKTIHFVQLKISELRMTQQRKKPMQSRKRLLLKQHHR